MFVVRRGVARTEGIHQNIPRIDLLSYSRLNLASRQPCGQYLKRIIQIDQGVNSGVFGKIRLNN